MIKRGSKIRVVKMDTAGGMDWQAKRLEGKVFTVRFIDSAGQIHLEETGIALLGRRPVEAVGSNTVEVGVIPGSTQNHKYPPTPCKRRFFVPFGHRDTQTG
jgi:hypothetical protein